MSLAYDIRWRLLPRTKTEPAESALPAHGRRMGALDAREAAGRPEAWKHESLVWFRKATGNRQELGPDCLTGSRQAIRQPTTVRCRCYTGAEVGVTAGGPLSRVVMALRSRLITVSYLSRNSDNEGASITFSA